MGRLTVKLNAGGGDEARGMGMSNAFNARRVAKDSVCRLISDRRYAFELYHALPLEDQETHASDGGPMTFKCGVASISTEGIYISNLRQNNQHWGGI